MPKTINPNLQHKFARDVASGAEITEWAKKNRVSKRTAYRWYHSPEVREEIENVRREILDEAIGRLSRHATSAAAQITVLAGEAESEAVRLQASRAVLAEILTVSNYAVLERRMVEIERRLQDSARAALSHPGSDAAESSRPAASDRQPGQEDASWSAP
jgi:hypothetical protein